MSTYSKTRNNPKFESHSRAVIAQGALTNSKRKTCFTENYPSHLTKGKGCFVWDTEGNRYTDFICGLGSNILGYGNVPQINAIVEAANSGLSLSLGSTLELDLADELNLLFPFLETYKFLKTGTDACHAAIRIARSHTGRKRVLSEGYHGWGDEFVSLTPPALGVHTCTDIEKLNSDLSNIDETVAAVIIEPVITDASLARKTWLEGLRALCTRKGVMLIFDEVITGFRVRRFSVSNDFSVEPDLICLGKAMSNGMPLSAVAGKKKVMSGSEYFVSSTFAGERASINSALSVIKQLRVADLNSFQEKCKYFTVRVNEIIKNYGVTIEGYGTRGVLQGNDMNKAIFMQEALEAGLMFGPSVFFSLAHVEQFESIHDTLKDLRFSISKARLNGPLPLKPFAQRSRE